MSNSWEDIPGSGGGSGSNASVGTNGASSPGSSTQIAYSNGSGNLTPVSPSNPLPVDIHIDTVTVSENLAQVNGVTVATGGAGLQKVAGVGSTGASLDSAAGTPNSQATTIQGNASGVPVPVSYNDTIVSGSLGSLNAVLTINTAGLSTVGVDISGAWVGTITPSVQVNGTFYPVNFVDTGGVVLGLTWSANNLAQINVAGMNSLQLKMTSYGSGSATVKLEGSAAAGVVSLAESLPQGTNVIGKTNVLDNAGNPINSLADGNSGFALEVSQSATGFFLDSVNSSTVQLAASATFAGAITNVLNQVAASILLTSDQPGTLTVNQYIDGAGLRLANAQTFAIAASVGFARSILLNGNYVKVSFQNTGASTTTTFNLNTYHGTIQPSNALGNLPISLADINGTAFSIGQQLAASSMPVVLPAAQITALTPPTTVTVTQAVGTNLHTVIDSSALPTGAATSALQTTISGNQTTLGSQTTKLNDGTNTAAVKAASTAAVAGDPALVVALSPNNNTLANALFEKITDGVNTAAVKAASTAPVAADPALVIALSPNSPAAKASGGRALANAPTVTTYSTPVTSGAYVQIIASTTSAANMVELFDSSGVALYFAVGGAGSEVNQFVIYPGGNGQVPLSIPAGSRISYKAVSTSASGASAFNVLNLYT